MGTTRKKRDMLSEELVGMAQNGWTASIGIDGRHSLDYAVHQHRRRMALAAEGQVVYATTAA